MTCISETGCPPTVDILDRAGRQESFSCPRRKWRAFKLPKARKRIAGRSKFEETIYLVN
jgi:hypothetical protein